MKHHFPQQKLSVCRAADLRIHNSSGIIFFPPVSCKNKVYCSNSCKFQQLQICWSKIQMWQHKRMGQRQSWVIHHHDRPQPWYDSAAPQPDQVSAHHLEKRLVSVWVPALVLWSDHHLAVFENEVRLLFLSMCEHDAHKDTCLLGDSSMSVLVNHKSCGSPRLESQS